MLAIRCPDFLLILLEFFLVALLESAHALEVQVSLVWQQVSPCFVAVLAKHFEE